MVFTDSSTIEPVLVLATVPGYPAAVRLWNWTKPKPVIFSEYKPGSEPGNPPVLTGIDRSAGFYLQVQKCVLAYLTNGKHCTCIYTEINLIVQ